MLNNGLVATREPHTIETRGKAWNFRNTILISFAPKCRLGATLSEFTFAIRVVYRGCGTFGDEIAFEQFDNIHHRCCPTFNPAKRIIANTATSL